MRLAHRSGRAEKDPAEEWYEGEIRFFEYCVIPLATNLADCGAFGIKYLQCARSNQAEWKAKGREMIDYYIGSCDINE